MSNKVVTSRPGETQQLDAAEGTTGGVGKSDCDVTGGALDSLRTALMNPYAAHIAPLGLKVYLAVNSVLNLFCGALQTAQGIDFTVAAFKTHWLWGKLFGTTRIGCGVTLFAGGALTLLQHIGETLQAQAVAHTLRMQAIAQNAGAAAPFAYIAMFLFLIPMCILFLHKEAHFTKTFLQKPEQANEAFLKNIRASTFAKLTGDGNDLEGKNTIEELKMFVREEAITALEKGGDGITGANADKVAGWIRADLAEKRRFFRIILVCSAIMITLMVLGLFVTNPIAVAVLFGVGTAVSLVFAYINIKNMQMALRSSKGTFKEKLPIYIITGLITVISIISILINPASWLIIVGITLSLLAIQVYLVHRLNKNGEARAQLAAKTSPSPLPT